MEMSTATIGTRFDAGCKPANGESGFRHRTVPQWAHGSAAATFQSAWNSGQGYEIAGSVDLHQKVGGRVEIVVAQDMRVGAVLYEIRSDNLGAAGTKRLIEALQVTLVARPNHLDHETWPDKRFDELRTDDHPRDSITGQFVRFGSHDDVIAMEPLNLVRPPTYRDTSPFRKNCRMMPLRLGQRTDAVRQI